MNRPENLVIHCSASPDHGYLDWPSLRKYHIEERNFIDIGYHYGIENVHGSYEILIGRPERQPGAHCREQGMNYRSLGVCLVGGDPWKGFDNKLCPLPEEQYNKLVELCTRLCIKHKISNRNIYFHRNFAPKPCPGYGINREMLRDDVNSRLFKEPPWENDDPFATERRVLGFGDRGRDVMWVQDKLGVETDGIFGPNTKSAVMEFQKEHGLIVDGIVGPQTWGDLFLF
jgi:peptidoglycan hydrolase-like protein with peptidoglycan-binding domain